MIEHKVLVTRRIPKKGLELLEKVAEVEVFGGDVPMSREALLERVPDVQGIICMLDDVMDAGLIDSARKLLAVSAYSVGFNNIDVSAATKNGIVVTNTPGVLREATADLTWALLMACARKVPSSDTYVRRGNFKGWSPELFLGREVAGRTIGIIGMGDIGAAVARRAKGFGMRVLYHNRTRSAREDEVGAELVTLDELLGRSDFISLHVPLSDMTFHMIGERELSLMGPTTILVNTSRGKIIDEGALVKALKDGKIAGAALDVYENEPSLSPGLADLDNVVLTPHIGSATFEARERMSIIAAKNLVNCARGQATR